MLPTLSSQPVSLADVMPSMLGALRGEENRLRLPRVRTALVVLVDGMGAHPLRARAGHARTLTAGLTRASTISSGFPTTTASALATLTTGVAAGQHGLVGYSVLDAANDRVINQLNGWDALIDPLTWQRRPTIFERSAELDIPGFVVAPSRYRDSGFSRAVLRGAETRGADSLDDRVDAARALLDEIATGIVYLYIPELDKAGHAHGSSSDQWTTVLERVDAAVRALVGSLRRDEGVLVTADHGMLDIPATSHVLFDEGAGLLDGVRHVAGEPRCLHLHVDPDASPTARATLHSAWLAAEGHRAWVATRAEAIAAGWFGVVDAEVAPRIGDVVVAARKDVAYYDGRITERSGRGMIGQHGSLSPAETAIPLLRFGAFA